MNYNNSELGQKVISEDHVLHDLFFQETYAISNDDIYKLILSFKILQTKQAGTYYLNQLVNNI